MKKRETYAESQARYLEERPSSHIIGMAQPTRVIDTNVAPRTPDQIKPIEVLEMTYTNWKDVTSIRRIVPIEIWFGKTDWHPEEQWFIKATDVDKNEIRDFALKDTNFKDVR